MFYEIFGKINLNLLTTNICETYLQKLHFTSKSFEYYNKFFTSAIFGVTKIK